MSPFTIIDNFLPEEYFNNLQKVVLGDHFPWYYSGSVGTEQAGEDYYFIHTFFTEGRCNSNALEFLEEIFKRLNIAKLINVKANMYPNVNKFLSNERHVDFEVEHKGAVFYVNTNNGFTVLEDGTKIPSVANRMLLFNSAELHNSTNCTDEKRRITINFNYL